MGKKVIVSIINDQSVPNMILIKNNMDSEYFINIVTDTMVDNNNYLINALNPQNIEEINNKFKKIKIQKHIENNIEKITESINSLKDIYDEAEQILVNATGGAKILSIALYQYFNEHYKSKSMLLYLNIDSISTSYNILNTHGKLDMPQSITLEEYLTSYGIEIVNNEDTKPKYPQNCANLLVNHSITTKGMFEDYKIQDTKKALASFMNILNEKYEKQSDTHDAKLNIKKELTLCDDRITKYSDSIIEYINYLHNTTKVLPDINNITYNSLKYINSGYFEEYLYYNIASILPYKENVEDYLKTGVKIKVHNPKRKTYENISNDQELDILFMYNNTVYYIECKTYTSPKIINESIFKQAAISNLLGLKKTNSFTTLNTYYERTLKELTDKMTIYNINLITGNDIKQNKILLKLKELCNIKI